MLMEIKKKKSVLVEDKESDWLQVWSTASSLDVKGKKAIKKIFFSLTGWFSQIQSQICMIWLYTILSRRYLRKEKGADDIVFMFIEF